MFVVLVRTHVPLMYMRQERDVQLSISYGYEFPTVGVPSQSMYQLPELSKLSLYHLGDVEGDWTRHPSSTELAFVVGVSQITSAENPPLPTVGMAVSKFAETPANALL